MELCKISVAFSLIVLALFSRMGTHGSIGATQPGSNQSNITVAVAPNAASAENGSSPQDFLNVHNAARAVVGVSPITWNNVVARYAADYAEKRISDCELVHSGGPYGENLAWSSGDLSGPDAVSLWTDEKDYYNLKSGVCDSGHVCRQYTQVIGRNSSRLGCAKVRCNNGGTFVICNYDPPSNDPIGRNQSNISVATAPNPSSAAEGSLSQDYLNVHNVARAAVGVRPITWDNVVARYAAEYAKNRISDCELVHSGGPYGENLAWSSADLSGPDAVRLWINEKYDYNLKSGVCDFGKVCGHYTQVIWHNSVHLGCAKARCNKGGTFIVCNYDPPGNIVGELPIDVNQSISRAISPSAAPSPYFFPYFFPSEHPKKRDMGGLVVGLIVGASALIFGLGLFFWFFSRTKRHKDDVNIDNHHHISDVFFSGGEFRYGMAPRKFSLEELAKVTNNFKGEKLGEGGFGAVYRGYLRDLDTHVAVKRISKASKQGIKEYASEVKIISRLRHKNLVKLIGWCHEKRELLLVYEFMANSSLDSHLFKGKSLLNWEVRYKIVQDLASALLYLHEEGDHCVLHRDIKTSNIMLNSNFNAKLGDFGLARLVDHAKGSQTTRLAGTMGYMAPECVSSGKISKESDVYSFGIVALEIACGRRSIEPEYEESKASLVAWVWDSYGNQRLLDVVDQKLCMEFDDKQIECLLIVGLWCVHPDPSSRPSIRQAIQVLNFEAPLPELPSSRPIPTYHAPIASGVKASEPCFSSLTITSPR